MSHTQTALKDAACFLRSCHFSFCPAYFFLQFSKTIKSVLHFKIAESYKWWKGENFFHLRTRVFPSDPRWKPRICFLRTPRSLSALEERIWNWSLVKFSALANCVEHPKPCSLCDTEKQKSPVSLHCQCLCNLPRVWRSFERHPPGEVQQYSCAKVLPLALGAGHYQWPSLGWHSHQSHARAGAPTRPAGVQKLQQVTTK